MRMVSVSTISVLNGVTGYIFGMRTHTATPLFDLWNTVVFSEFLGNVKGIVKNECIL